MDEDVPKQPSEGSDTIDDELREWPASTYAEVAAAEGRAMAARLARIAHAKRQRQVVGAGMLLLLFVSVPGSLWWYFTHKAQVVRPQVIATASQPPAPSMLAPQPPVTPTVANTQLTVKGTDNDDFYKKTEATLRNDGRDILSVVKYDLYASKFIRDNTRLKNQDTLASILGEIRDQLDKSWILIFATASLEGYEDYNLELCRNRLYAVRNLIERDARIHPRGIWGILAGEYKIDMPGFPPGLRREDEENRIARAQGESWLADQRRLILITIREIYPIARDASDQVPFVVAEHIYKKELLPSDYDAPDSRPFLLTSGETPDVSDRPIRSGRR